ncbi:hypothetical protein AGMMS49921_03050 [Endomicrobiia bacterium]|nr:hypothetical protein AGMMS49921_03050 [Endomicrobiia bacterium]
MRKITSTKRYILAMPVLFAISAIFGGCASSLTGYYKSLRTKIDSGDYEEAAKFVDKSKSKYGSSNVLVYYLDTGVATHFAKDYNTAQKSLSWQKKNLKSIIKKG